MCNGLYPVRVQLLTSYDEKGFFWGEGVDKGGVRGGRKGGGGQRTLHIKGYTELSACVCALYSVCFPRSFLSRVSL